MNALRVAFHEAAHALVAWYYGFFLSKVTIQPQLGDPQNVAGLCRATHNDGFTDVAAGPRTLSSESVFFTLAGKACDDLYFPAEPPGHLYDFRILARMQPTDNWTRRMHEFPRNKKSLDDFFEAFKGPVVRLLSSKRGKRALTALADALIKHDTISGAGAVEILEKTWGKPLPRRAIPAAQHANLTNEKPKSYLDMLRLINAHIDLMQGDIQQLRGDDSPECEHLDKIWLKLQILKIVAAVPLAAPGRRKP